MRKTLLNIVLCLMAVTVNAQNTEGFTNIVKEYKNKIEEVMTEVAPINTQKENEKAHSLRKFEEAHEYFSKEVECRHAFKDYFIFGGMSYRIGRNPIKDVIMNITYVDKSGKRKTQKKKVKDITKFLCNKEIPAERIKVTSIQVFRICDAAETNERGFSFSKVHLTIDGYSTFEIDENGNISEINETTSYFTILHEGLTSWRVNQHVKEFGASPLFGNINVTIWTK